MALAHRGGTETAPENIWAAFEAAVALGYRYLETDVHDTADGVRVAFHTDTLDRMASRPGRIADLSWPAVARIRIQEGRRIPRLGNLIGAWPEIRIDTDPKRAMPPPRSRRTCNIGPMG